MELQNTNQPHSLLDLVMASRYGQPQSCNLLPSPDQTTASLLDDAAASAMAAMFGPDVQPREALRMKIQANAELLASGDTDAMKAALARQATGLELGMHGLLHALASTKSPEHRLALARAVSTLHGAALRSISAIRQISHGSEQTS